MTADRIIIRWSDSTEAKTLVERGVDFLRAGDYDKGIGILCVALQRDPADADALFNLAMALSDQGKLDLKSRKR
ncbi:MAG: tetratricopeptide repeat protein [Akkermansiaceae bacterium]